MHFRSRLDVVLVVNGSEEVLFDDAESVAGPDVGDGVAALRKKGIM